MSASKKTKKYGDLTEADYKHESDTVDGQQIYFKTAITANTPQDFINLDANAIQFIEQSLFQADSLIKLISPDKGIHNVTVDALYQLDI